MYWRNALGGFKGGQIGAPPQVEGIANAALVEADDIYPEGGSGEIGMEINANMVEAFDGWVGKEQVVVKNDLVAAIEGQSMSPRRRLREYRRGARRDEFVTPQRDQRRRRSREPAVMRGARQNESVRPRCDRRRGWSGCGGGGCMWV